MNAGNPTSYLASGRLLVHNTLWNLVGQALPMLVGIVTIPVIIRVMGVDRFGVLSLAWVVVGYFSLFDLGIGRALTKLVADKLAANEEQSIAPLARTSLLLLLVLGIFGALVTVMASHLLVFRLLTIPPPLQRETIHGFYVLAFSIPIVTLTAGLRGILEALQQFRVANLIRIPMSIWSFASPLVVFPFSHSVAAVIVILTVGRGLACLIHALVCLRAVPGLLTPAVDFRLVVPLLKVGCWMTVGNICGPALIYGDRFLISSILSIGAVTYYTAPFDMISRLVVIPVAVSGVLFPAFAMRMVQDPGRVGVLLERGIKYVFLLVFPVTLIVATFARELLQIWLGASFAQHSAITLRFLAVGMLMSCLTNLPFSSLQGIGQSAIAGKVLLIDLLVYFAVVIAITRNFGIEGTAAAWAARATLELLIFLALNRSLLPRHTLPMRAIAVSLIGALGLFYCSTLIDGIAAKVIFVVLTFAIFLACGWFWILRPTERAFLLQMGFRQQFPSVSTD